MKRLLVLVTVLCLTGCLEIFKAPPKDDPTTMVNEMEEHNRKVEEQEGAIRDAGAIGGALAPPGFNFIPGLITTAILGLGTWMRSRGDK